MNAFEIIELLFNVYDETLWFTGGVFSVMLVQLRETIAANKTTEYVGKYLYLFTLKLNRRALVST